MGKLALAAFGLIVVITIAAFPKFLHELAEYAPLQQGESKSTQPHQPSGLQLKDGNREWMGVFRDSPVREGEKSYSSQKLGISLRYPVGYLLFERVGEEGEPPILLIAPQKEALESIERASAGVGSEGPPTINLAFYPKDAALEDWLRTSPYANFKRSTSSPPEENTLMSVTVAGRPALSYENDGLYWNQYVAFEHNGWIVVASSAMLDRAEPNPDFQTILASIELQ